MKSSKDLADLTTHGEAVRLGERRPHIDQDHAWQARHREIRPALQLSRRHHFGRAHAELALDVAEDRGLRRPLERPERWIELDDLALGREHDRRPLAGPRELARGQSVARANLFQGHSPPRMATAH